MRQITIVLLTILLAGCTLRRPTATEAVTTKPVQKIPTSANGTGATVTGQVVLGFGDHSPVSGLPLRIRQDEDEDWDAHTDENGFFTLTNLPVGHVDIDNSHLSFQVTIDSPTQFIDLGKVKYPLMHPYNYYYWQAAPLADLYELLSKGEDVGFTVCAEDRSWVRPSAEMQREKVYSRLPFSRMPEKRIERFEQPAILYDTVNVAKQSFPAGLNLDGLGADWLYLSGLWTAPNPLLNSDCSYSPEDLESLFAREQLEIWLFGYNVTRVQELDKEQATFAEGSLCDPSDRTCLVRPGHHYAVHVVPASGFQIIRYPGKQDVLSIHLVEAGEEILTIP